MSRPITPTPETFVTARVPRTRKYYLGEKRNIAFKVPEQRGVSIEWATSKVMVYKPDGSTQELNAENGFLTEQDDGLFFAFVDFNITGMWTLIFFYGPENSTETFQYRLRARVVA